MTPGFVHFMAQEHFYSQWIFTHVERVCLTTSYFSHYLSPGLFDSMEVTVL